MRKFMLLLLLIITTALTVVAGGYQVGLHSTRNIGMGLIGTSLNQDASCLFYNPGGASFIDEKFSFSGGVTFLMSQAWYQAKGEAYQEQIKSVTNFPFYFYAAYKPVKDVSVGVAVNTPYGLSMAWPDEWKGRFLIQNVKFNAITIQPTVSYKINEIIGIGAGLVISTGSVDLNQAIPLDYSGGEGKINIKGHTTQFGFNAGIMVHPMKELSLGLDYRSKITMKVKNGDATFTVPPSVASEFPNQQVDVTLPLPANLDFGASYTIKGKWMIGLDLNYVFWNAYDSLIFDFHKETDNVKRNSSPRLYENRLITRFGVQWMISKLITVRVGGYYDPSPVKTDYLDPMLPSADEIGLTCGLSIYPTKGFSIDLSYEYLMGMERSGQYSPANFAGTYKSTFHMPGIGLTYNF